MIFKTAGDKSKPAILFFHAMGVTGDSSMPVAECLEQKYYCIMPTSTVYCAGQKYRSKTDEIQQIMTFLKEQGIREIELVVASSIGADLAMAFLTNTQIPVKHVFFDGGQFAQIGKTLRKIMVPFIYLAIKSIYRSKGKTLKKINSLLEDISRNGNAGIGKPEPLTGNLAGFWSRRINDKDRLIYKFDQDNIYVLACRYHYSDK